MAGYIYLDNDLNVWLKNFKFEDGSGPINDALLYLSIGDVSRSGTITALTNANPIVATSAAHLLTNGKEIVIVNAVGNKAANGPQLVANVTSNTFELQGVAGSGDLQLPGLVTSWPRWFATLPGLHGAAFSLVAPGKYKSVVPASTNILPDQEYHVVATSTNYGYQVQTTVIGRIRELGKLL